MTTDVLADAPVPSAESAASNAIAPGRREFFRSCAKGGGLAAIPFIGVLLLNGFNMMSDSFTTRFYASQARSLLRGHWDMPKVILEYEGFQHGAHWYMYYGPFPALLRIPFVHVIPGAAERMTQSMILLATAIALVCSARIVWSVRLLVRGDRPVTRQERLWGATFVFVVGAGSAFLFLASQAWIYHEAEAWGAALAIASFDALLVWLRRPSRWALIAASAFAWASVLSRGSVGFGPIAALGVLTIVVLFPRLRSVAGVTVDATRRAALGLAAATLVPLVSYCYVNYAKFGNPLVFPTASQNMSQINPGRQYFLAHSGGSYFSLKFIPTTLLQYFRPDALRLGTLLPFVDFPHSPHVVGGVVFDALEPTSSIPSSMPFLFVLAIVGIVAVCRRRSHTSAAGARVLRIPLAGAVIGAVSVFPFGYIAERYLSDFMPLLVLAAALGLQVILRWSEDRAAASDVENDAAADAPRRRDRRKLVWTALGVLAAVSVFVNVALALDYHFTTDWNPQEISAPFIALQYRVHDLVPGTSAPDVLRGAHLPANPSKRGTVFVVGDCEGVYWSPGDVRELAWGPWSGVALSRAAGRYRLQLSLQHVSHTTTEPVVTRGAPGHIQKIAAIVRPDNTVQFVLDSEGHEDLPTTANGAGYFPGQIIHFTPGRTYPVTVTMDHNNGHVSVLWGDNHRVAFRFVQFQLTPQQSGSFVFPTNRVSIGRNDLDRTTTPALQGAIVEHPLGKPSLCKALGVR